MIGGRPAAGPSESGSDPVHELSIMGSVLDIVLENATKNNAAKVKKINLRIGMLSDVIPDWAQTYFDMLSKDTMADGALLDIERVPVLIKCRQCGNEFGFSDGDWRFTCDKCESSDIELLQGRELAVASIEIE